MTTIRFFVPGGPIDFDLTDEARAAMDAEYKASRIEAKAMATYRDGRLVGWVPAATPFQIFETAEPRRIGER